MYRLCPEGGGDTWGAPLSALLPAAEADPCPELPQRTPGVTIRLDDLAEAPIRDALGQPSPGLRARAATGLEKFWRPVGDDHPDDGARDR